MATPHRKVFLLAFLVLVAAHGFLMAAPRLLPLTDLPDHTATATLFRESDQSSNDFDGCFTLAAFPAANTAHQRSCASRVFPSVKATNRSLCVSCALLTPSG